MSSKAAEQQWLICAEGSSIVNYPGKRAVGLLMLGMEIFCAQTTFEAL